MLNSLFGKTELAISESRRPEKVRPANIGTAGGYMQEVLRVSRYVPKELSSFTAYGTFS